MSDDEVLAAHDIMHEIMEKRYGSPKRKAAPGDAAYP